VLSDGDLTLVLANAAQVRNVPGRETDVADATWLADLLAHGLVRAGFVPDAPTQAMRALLRTRKQLVREQASHVQRLQKTLEDANLKLASVLTDVMGLSGRGPGQCPEPSRRWWPARPTPTGCSPWCTAGSGPSRRGCAPR
jgi:hypothetical protein